MEEYRASGIGPTAEIQANATEFNAALDGWHDFIADFERELDDGKATFSRHKLTVQQTVEEEYSTYVMGAPSSGTMLDTVKFWQVSIYETVGLLAVACQIDICIPLDSRKNIPNLVPDCNGLSSRTSVCRSL
jgi:hypothetical protein